MRILIGGGGIFGLTAALALRARGHDITVVDPGPLPHPLAESTDLSKVVRIDYGADEDYTVLGERALDGWRRWNAQWPAPLFHETGVTFLAREPMRPLGFEYESFELLRRRGHPLVRLDADAITRRFPAYAPGAYVDGYFNPIGGWAHAAAVCVQLAQDAIARGVVMRSGAIALDSDADLVILCAGSWVPQLLPELSSSLRAVGQPVFHLRPRDPSLFEAARFPVFGADISRTGYYGFPINAGVVKIANHGLGITNGARAVTADQEAALREMLRESFPALADAPIEVRRLCVYCDTIDGNFWIARHPERANLVVATGGSGHAFKFAPVLGELIASVALGESHPLADRFRWRPELTAPRKEAARA